MSHFTKVSTRMVDLESIKRALASLGYRAGEGTLVGWMGQAREAALVVDVPGSEHNIGICRSDDGTWEVVADWYGIKLDQTQFIQSLLQKYAYTVVCDKLTAQGFQLENESVAADGAVHLRLRRSS